VGIERMTQINPFTGSILGTPQVQRQQAADKDRQVRRAQEQSKNAALTEDRTDHQVESSEELKPIQPEARKARRFKRSGHKPEAHSDTEQPDGQSPHIDLTA
jgi:hypothetical protein